MAAGLATLKHLRAHREIYTQLDKMSAKLVSGVAAAAKAAGLPMSTNRVGSMFTWFFTGRAVTDWTTASSADTEAFGRFYRVMLDNGIYLPPSQFEAAFLGTAHTEADIEQTIAVAKLALAAVQQPVAK
jgi:glutamate-1-semialdehyde 2,1-aminomutase